MNNPNFPQMMANRGSNVQASFMQHYRNQQPKTPQGWQQSVNFQERSALALNFFTSYRLLKPEVSEVEAMRMAITFESQHFANSQTKDQYASAIKSKLVTMQGLRQQHARGMQNTLNNTMGAINGMNPAQMTMIGQPGVQARQNTPQQFSQAFANPQLQRPMQASPIPMTQGQSSMGMNAANLANMQQGNNQQVNMQQPQQQNLSLDQNMINQLARRLMSNAKPEIRQKFEEEVAAWPDQKKQQLQSQGMPPIFHRFREQAVLMLRSKQAGNPEGMGGLGPDQNGGMQQLGQPGQMQNQQMNMNQRQPNQNFDFNALENQQIEALRVQNQGQTVVPASNNPNGAQMVAFGGQNAQPGQQQNAAMAQRHAQVAYQNAQRQQAAQAQAQAQAQARAQHMQQQAQARAAQSGNPNQLLQGQIGGLNLPPGTQQPSPAMPMLNRPLGVPPGQPGPRTPQQTPQAHVPVMTPQGGQPQGMQHIDPQVATQLMREAQQRATAAAQGQPLTEQVRMGLLPGDLDPVVKAQLLKLPEAQFRNIISQYMTNMRRYSVLQNGAMAGGQPGQGQANMIINPTQALQMAITPNLQLGANLGNMNRGPGMNIGQPAPGGMGGQQAPMGQQSGPGAPPAQAQRLMEASALLRSSPGIIQSTDHSPFPPNVINQNVRQNVPQEVKTWHQLKQWANQNPGILPGVNAQKLLLLQVLHFQDIRRQQANIQQAGGRMMPQNGPGGMAPPAQMGQMNPGQGPPRPQQQPPNMASLGAIQVSPQEIQMFRQKLPPPQQASATDEQLRVYIQNQKLNALKQQQMRNLQVQAAQRNQGQQPQQHPPMPGQGLQAPRPPSTQPQSVQATPQAKPVAKPQPAQANQQPTQNTLNKGVKRPNEDTEVNMEASNAHMAPQAPAMVPSRSHQGLGLTQEQMSKLTPTQQQQMRAQLLKAQDASNNKPQGRAAMPSKEELTVRMNDPVRLKKYKLMLNEEDQKAPRGPPVQMSPETRAHLQTVIKNSFEHFKKAEQALRIFLVSFEERESENVARTIMRSRILLLRQLSPADGTLLSELTLSDGEIKDHIRRIMQFVGKVMSTMSGQNKPQQNQQPQGQSQTQAGRPPQLNAANLKIVEEQQRQQKAPQAPTNERPPFPIGGQSPSGAPTYFDPTPKLGPLQLPEKKRAKIDPGSQTPTPGVKASPHMGSGKGSPELKRQAPPERPAEQRPTFRCRDASCEYSARGFDTQAELDAHISQVHTRIDDPQQFAIDSMAGFLDIDPKTGQPKVDPTAAARAAKPLPAANRAPVPVKPGHTPSMSQNVTTPAGPVATPMTRVPTQPGIRNSPSTNLLKTPQTSARVTTPSTGAPAKATPSSVTKPAPKEQEAIVVPEFEKEEEPQPLLPSSLFDFSYEEIYPALDANGPMTILDLKDEDNSWALRSRPSSPIDTPDSTTKDTPSTRQSDISENDNLQISIDFKDADIPDAWTTALNSSTLPLDAQLSEDLQSLGVALPPMDNDDMMLFYGDSIMMDLDTLDKTMDSMDFTHSLDPSLLVS